MIQIFNDAQSYWRIDFTNLGGDDLEAEIDSLESEDPQKEEVSIFHFYSDLIFSPAKIKGTDEGKPPHPFCIRSR